MENTLNELKGAGVGKPEAPSESVRVYRPLGTAVGKMVSTSIRFFPDLGYSFVVLSNYDDGADNVSALLVQMITSVSAEN